ncbi:hypothetical protein VH86_20880 [Pantoea sp. BL1]|uniref:hypothetical protein n=1 Tax=Pantoea sp. SM3 TaxID=1628192 RepID=UPI0005F82607|nr:hypothetical protein [Pantoea sp. SM3]KJV32016.1 hypothetical protein VI01_09500 [Pantoea sp. SM3]KJV46383.1 hypothetical protein VH86_20880 [Pantoea sp. BL1]
MLDNVAKQAIIGWVDGRLRLVRHSNFMSSTAVRGNHRQENEQRCEYSNYRARNEIALIIREMRGVTHYFMKKRTGWSDESVADQQRVKG